MNMTTSLACAALLALGSFSAPAAVLLGNFTPSNASDGTSLNTASRIAVVFSMPSMGYTVDSVTLTLSGYDSSVDTPSIGFFAEDGSGPGAQTGSFLINPTSSSTATANFTFVPNGAITLEANNNYWLVVDLTAGSVTWRASNSDTPTSRTPTGEATFTDYQDSSNNGAVYTVASVQYSFEINATVVPEPAEHAAIAGLGLVAFAAWRKRRPSAA